MSYLTSFLIAVARILAGVAGLLFVLASVLITVAIAVPWVISKGALGLARRLLIFSRKK